MKRLVALSLLAALAGCHSPLGVLRTTAIRSSTAVAKVPVSAQYPATSLTASVAGRSPNAGGISGVVYGPGPGIRLPAFRVTEVSTWLVPVTFAEMDLSDSLGRPLMDAVTTTNDVGRFGWSSIHPSAPVVFVRATYRLDGNPVFLERAIAAPRIQGGVTTELRPSSTLVLKALRARAPFYAYDLDHLSIPRFDALCARAAQAIQPTDAANMGAMTDEQAAQRLENLAPGAIAALCADR